MKLIGKIIVIGRLNFLTKEKHKEVFFSYTYLLYFFSLYIYGLNFSTFYVVSVSLSLNLSLSWMCSLRETEGNCVAFIASQFLEFGV